ncbi:MAG TPA: LysR family substrate-binding domain-containing protein [Bryobacteraceae bacterium]
MEGHPEIDLVPVHSEPFVLVVPSSHRLAMKKEIRLKETADERFVVYHRDDAPGFHDQIMGILRDANVVPAVSQTAGEMQTLVALVAAKMGLSLLPASAMRGIPGVTACRIKDPIPLSAIARASHKTNQQPAMVTFRKFALCALHAKEKFIACLRGSHLPLLIHLTIYSLSLNANNELPAATAMYCFPPTM